jgi:hypothetical protein
MTLPAVTVSRAPSPLQPIADVVRRGLGASPISLAYGPNAQPASARLAGLTQQMQALQVKAAIHDLAISLPPLAAAMDTLTAQTVLATLAYMRVQSAAGSLAGVYNGAVTIARTTGRMGAIANRANKALAIIIAYADPRAPQRAGLSVAGSRTSASSQ